MYVEDGCTGEVLWSALLLNYLSEILARIHEEEASDAEY